ncbi:alpha-hydroxy-acid oxidizing protein [Rhizobium paknamense]|uniref:Isopentenyl diphosphate isomerase/L-lactate dehydrogenase-like FMN-dependent dehydrogenase n=1 Tax=Rhizobium paknamense TaxID=1206817 RepID=A0ABU0IJ77_9HYPH|nr:isopentenyl diphosphate isomerase/L-lactate dehydrogenase-like FMN-dependent dehydrogenase [Rhizobium paknamense]
MFIGRPFIYAAAIGGIPGVRKAIDLLNAEILRNMGLLGINKIEEVTSDLLIDAPP